MPDFNSIGFSGQKPLLKEVTAERLNAILQEIKRNKPIPGRGITTRATGTGISIDLAARTVAAAPQSVSRQPFDLIATKDASPATTYSVTVRPGTLNGILPSNWSATFTCAATGIYYAKAVITTDGTAVTAVSIECNTTAPTVQAPQAFGVETTIRYLFGLFSAGSVYRVIGDGHISLNPSVWMTKAKASPAAPGELPWVQYYQLES